MLFFGVGGANSLNEQGYRRFFICVVFSCELLFLLISLLNKPVLSFVSSFKRVAQSFVCPVLNPLLSYRVHLSELVRRAVNMMWLYKCLERGADVWPASVY